jgi:hypothetical protein
MMLVQSFLLQLFHVLTRSLCFFETSPQAHNWRFDKRIPDCIILDLQIIYLLQQAALVNILLSFILI